MSEPQQYNPVTFYPPALDPAQRLPGDFRPLPPKEEPVKKEAVDGPDPKDLSAPEFVPSLPSEVDPPNTPSTPAPPAMIVPAAKDSGKPKVSEPSTPTS